MIRFTGIATLLLLIIAGVPWYWRFLPQSGNEMWSGVPAWFVVSVAVSVGVSVLTAIQFLTPWAGEAGEARVEQTGGTQVSQDGNGSDA